MKLNAAKFEVLKYGKDDMLNSFTYTTPDQIEIIAKAHILDLGVTLSEDLTFDKHIENIIERVNNLTGWVLRTFESRDKKLMLTLYKALLLPRIDYGTQLYFPFKITLITEIEGLQRHYTKRIQGCHDQNYYERLKSLKLYSLQRRSERYALIYIWKIIENKVVNLSSNTVRIKQNQRTGRKIVIPALSKISGRNQTLQYNSFVWRAGRLFNNLPLKLRNLTNVDADSFKRALDKVLLSISDEPPVPGYATTCENSLQCAQRWDKLSGLVEG